MDDSTTPDRPVPPVAIPDPHTDEALPHAEEGMRPEAAANPSVRPEQDEPGGPLGGLVGTAAAQTASEATPADTTEAALLANMGVESEGIESGQLLGLVVAVIVGIAALGVVLILLFYVPTLEQAGEVAGDVGQYPELEQVRTDGRAKTKLFTRNDSTYQIPIANAMSAVVGRYHAAAAPAGLPATRQQWNTLMLNRGMGTTIQTPNGRQGAATVENQRLAAESEGATGAAPVAPPAATADEAARTSEPAPAVPADAPTPER